jgi:hypothetical protein
MTPALRAWPRRDDPPPARTWDPICRHTALTALAQLRTAAIRAAITGTAILPPAATTRESTAPAAGQGTAIPGDLRFHPGDAPVAPWAAGPARQAPPVGLSATETLRIEHLAATGKPASSPAPASPSAFTGQTGGAATRPAPDGTTTAPASSTSPPDP